MSSRGVVSTCLALVVAALPLLPPTHVHDVEAAGHHATLVHTHSSGHHHHDAEAAHPDEPFEDHDTVVLTLELVYARPHAIQVLAAPAPVVHLLDEPPPVTLPAIAGFVEREIHDPPRAPVVLRGPPSSSLL